MKSKTTAMVILQRSDWFLRSGNLDIVKELEDEGHRLIEKLGVHLEVLDWWTVTTADTADAVSIKLRSNAADLVILVYQTRVEQLHIEKLIKGLKGQPLVVWCALPWRRIPRTMTYEEYVRSSSFASAASTLTSLKNQQQPYLAAYGSIDDPSVLETIRTFAEASRVAAQFTKSTLGCLTGGDEQKPLTDPLLAQLGLPAKEIPVIDLANAYQSIRPVETQKVLQQVKQDAFDVMVTDQTLENGARMALALEKIALKNGLTFMLMPAHNARLRELVGFCPGLPPFLGENPAVYCAPTTDLETGCAFALLSQLSETPSMILRFMFWDKARNVIVGGHTGAQNPHGISGSTVIVSGDNECDRNDPDSGTQVEFIARPGRVTLLQLSKDHDQVRATMTSGVCLESEPWIEGLPHAVIRLDCTIDQLIHQVSEEGGSDYWVMAYGNYIPYLEAFFELKSIPFETI